MSETVGLATDSLLTRQIDPPSTSKGWNQEPDAIGEMYVPGCVAPSCNSTNGLQASWAWVKAFGGVITILVTVRC
jgi:hypothetical protein